MWMVLIFPKMSEADGDGKDDGRFLWIPLIWNSLDSWGHLEWMWGRERKHFFNALFLWNSITVSQTCRNPEWNRQMDVAEGLEWNQPAMIRLFLAFYWRKQLYSERLPLTACETDLFCSRVPAFISSEPLPGDPQKGTWNSHYHGLGVFKGL